MFAFDQSLFWYKLVFAAELFAAETLFTLRLEKRGRFWLRVAASAALFAAVTFFTPILGYNALYVSAMFLFLFFVSVLLLKFCYRETWINVIFCGIAAYAAQHIAYSLYQMIMAVTYLDGGLSSGIYEDGQKEGGYSVYTFLVYLACYCFIYGMAWYLFGRTIVGSGELYIDNATLLWLAGLIVFVSIVLNAIVVYSEALQERVMQIVSYLYGTLSCVLALMVQFALKRQKKLEGELGVVEQMWHKDKEHYKLAKETIKIINLKCHDLKHQIRNIRLKGRADDSELKEIENSVLIYDSVVKTGNDALDVLITEKSLFCERHGIKLTCMADGERLNFMKPNDIYSLFGNALDNAVEHVKRYEDKEKRFIRLTVKGFGRVLTVHIENYFDGVLDMSRGLPRTTKGDTDYHGYGIISMKTICEKYGGNLFIKAKDSLFLLDMILPVPDSGQ